MLLVQMQKMRCRQVKTFAFLPLKLKKAFLFLPLRVFRKPGGLVTSFSTMQDRLEIVFFSSSLCFSMLALSVFYSSFVFKLFSSPSSLSVFFFFSLLHSPIYIAEQHIEANLHSLSSQPSVLGMEFPPLDDGQAPSA